MKGWGRKVIEGHRVEEGGEGGSSQVIEMKGVGGEGGSSKVIEAHRVEVDGERGSSKVIEMKGVGKEGPPRS